MSKIDATISATTDGTYGLINSLIGQIKTILLNDSNVSVLSDNDPDNTVARTLIYTVGGSLHPTKIYASSATALGFSTLCLDGSTAVVAAATYSPGSGAGLSVKFLYNAKIHMFVFNNDILKTSLYLNVGDTENGWYVKPCGSSTSSIALNDSSDTQLEIKRIAYGNLDYSGKFLGVPIRFKSGTVLSEYYNPYFYGTSTEIISSGSSFFTNDGYNFLVIAAYYMLSDQVPS